jgi:2-keto-3-deoxy-L-rhamnonate aldolase RhmA
VPLLYTAEDAKKLVTSAKFPPVGQRGFGSPFPMERFVPSLGSSDYLKQANEALLTMVQIETKEALENVDAIAAVAGIDLLFIGPFDLGNNIGHPIMDGNMHDNLHTAIEKIFKAAKAADKKAGIFCTSGEQSKEYADMVRFAIIQRIFFPVTEVSLGIRHDKCSTGCNCTSCIPDRNSEHSERLESYSEIWRVREID